MKYVALIRGINVGGNSMIAMAELREAFGKEGFTNVSTYINSGNVLFETTEKKVASLEHNLEQIIDKKFRIRTKVVIRTDREIRRILEELPAAWNSKEFRCYIAFIKNPMTPKEIAQGTKPKEGTDYVGIGNGVVYLVTKKSGLTKSGFTKLIGTKIYQYMTMRNLNTVKKLDILLTK